MVQVEVERTIQAGAGALWTYLSTPQGLSAWHADEVRGSLGRGEFLARYPSLGAELTLKVVTVDPGHQVTLGAGESRVEIRLLPIHELECRVHITHQGLDESDDLDGFRASWSLALGLLDLAATRHPSIPRQVRWLFGSAAVPVGLVHYYFSSQIGLGEWLGTSSSDLGPPGSPVRIALEEGLMLSGEVLCHEPHRDVCVRWSEQDDAALVLRTLPGGPQRRQLALAVSTFGRSLEPRAEEALTRALKRLEARLKKTFSS